MTTVNERHAKVLAHRWHTARAEEQARQIFRENERYGRLTGSDVLNLRAARLAYDLATAACWNAA